MKTLILKEFGLCLLCVSLSACGISWFASPKTNPIIEDKIKYENESIVGTLATTADRRLILVKLKEEKFINDGGKEETVVGQFCAEPPPDAAENIASQIALALEAAVKTPQAEGSGRLEFARQLATSIQQLFHRAQGVQFYRDGYYNLCQSFLNKVLTRDELKTKVDNLMILSYALIMKELELTNGIIGGPDRVSLPHLNDIRLSSVAVKSPSSDWIRANNLIDEIQKLKNQPKEKKKDQETQAKIVLVELHDILKKNANLDPMAQQRTLSDEEIKTLLGKLRPLAKSENQDKLVLPSQLKEFDSLEKFQALFIPFPS